MKDKFNIRFKRFLKDKEVRYLFRNSSYKISFQGVSIIVGFFISWCFGNFTSVEFYGNFLFINSILAFFLILSFTGIHQSLLQYVAKGYDNFLNTAVKKIVMYSTSGSILLLFCAIFYTYFIEFNYVILVCLIIGSLFFPFSSVFGIYEYFLEGKKMFKKSFIYNLIVLLTLNCLSLILIFILQNLIFYFSLYFGIQLVFNIYFIRSCKRLITKKEINAKIENEALKFGLFMTKYKSLTLICQSINSIIIGILYSPSVLAIYLVGIGLPYYFLKLAKPAYSVLLPKFSEENSFIPKKVFFICIFSSIFLFIGLIIILPLFIDILFPNYSDSIPYGIAYSFIFLVYPLVVLLSYYFRGKIEKNIIRNSQILPEFINLVLIFPLLLLLGIFGLILAEFLKYILKLLIYLINYKKINLL